MSAGKVLMATKKQIQLARLTRTADARHTVNVPIAIEDSEGDVEIRVVYRGMSIREWAALQKKYEGSDVNDVLPQLLADQVVELPDILDGEKPVAPTVEFFQTLDTFVLHRISKAIREDRTAVNPTMM